MEYVVFGFFILGFIMFVLTKEVLDEKKRRKKFIYELRHNFGQEAEREYKPEQFRVISRYYEKHPEDGQIDDITWNDLGMDDIFKRINTAHSSAGEEYLYYTLRTPSMEETRLKHLDEMTEYFSANEDDRVELQLGLADLGRTGKSSLYDYLDHLDVLGNRSNGRHYIMNGLFIPVLLLVTVRPSYGLLCFVLLSIINIILYFKEKNEIDPYIISFAYVMRLLHSAEKLEKRKWEVCEEEVALLRKHRKALGSFRRGSFWLMSPSRMANSGNPLDIILDYLRMMFHLDLIKFNQMLSQVREHQEDVGILVQTVGFLETAVMVGAYRQRAQGAWCKPEFSEHASLCAQEMYHPLIANPVKNSIRTEKGVLLTGSNASGKSTFLKTVAVNAILAQTIYTCSADSYQAGFYRICSSMALKDDLSSKESYYIVEIKAMKRILTIAEHKEYKVLCFVDEVLRGTNTIERISASTQILSYLAGQEVICFAATHDIELTALLGDIYNNYHFEEEVENGDVKFNYKLLSGKAETRNAIKLLSVMGYSDTIIEKADAQAKRFAETGNWIR